MAKKALIIVESPTKANTIRGFLGPDCRIIASKGHIRTLPTQGMAIDIKHGYKPEYIIEDSKKSVIAEMKDALRSADELILATDEDREGESISWHLLEVLKPSVPVRRMVFHEITKKAILEAFNNGRELDLNLVHAQEARRVLDRLYGYTLSPLLWSKLGINTLAAGRVQTPGLRLIVERERLRMAYMKSEYWDIRADFAQGFKARLESLGSKRVATGKDFNPDTGRFTGSSKVLLLNQEDTQAAISALKGEKFTITSIEEKPVVQHPAPPFMTSTLQQEGNRKLHLSARETMSVAQSLYEKGFITYMRTDSLVLSEEGAAAARSAAAERYGKSYVSDSVRKYASRSANAQEAHEAIRPAGDRFTPPEETGLSGRELSLYTLIYRRTLACQMKDARKVSTTVAISAGNAVFTANGVRTEFPGFTKVYVEGSDHDDEQGESVLPLLEKGQMLDVTKLEGVQHQTKEPVRYTEATLVRKLEELGIGRPSTYATIIDRILEKNYVIKESNALVPTFIGFAVIQVLEYFPQYIDYGFTSRMENDLDGISRQEINEQDYLKNFYEGPEGLESQVRQTREKIVPATVKTVRLPNISEKNTVTIGKYGPYVRDENGTYYSVPENWAPENVTNAMLENLMKKKPGNPVLGTSSDGKPVFYCTGKFGDYWQLGDKAKDADVLRFKVPRDLLGKDVPLDDILAFFTLPRTVGCTEDGQVITSSIGKYGPYIHCSDRFYQIKGSQEVLTITELEARRIISGSAKDSVKDSAKGASKVASSRRPGRKETVPLKDFGVQEGEPLDIREGRYGFYMKHGSRNIRLAERYQRDADACKAMSLDEALTYLRK